MKALLSHLSQEFSDSLCLLQHPLDIAEPVCTIGRIIGKRKLLLDIDNGINTESAKPLFHPPADVFVDFLSYLRILPVEIRLLLVEYMEILFIRMSRKFFPYRTTEIAPPVAGSLVILFVPDIKEISILSVRILNGLLKPLMLIGAVIYHQIHKDVHLSFFRFCDQPVHILHGPKPRINRIIICNVISLVCKWRFIDWGKPEDICSQFLQIIKLADDSRDIPDPVSVGIIKALGVYLIYHLVMPPFSFHRNSSYACLIMQYCFRSNPFFCTIPYNLNPNFSYMETFAGLWVSREIISLCLSA